MYTFWMYFRKKTAMVNNIFLKRLVSTLFIQIYIAGRLSYDKTFTN